MHAQLDLAIKKITKPCAAKILYSMFNFHTTAQNYSRFKDFKQKHSYHQNLLQAKDKERTFFRVKQSEHASTHLKHLS